MNKFILSALRKSYGKLKTIESGKLHYHNKVLSAHEGNDQIRNLIMDGRPFLAGRLGSTELSVLANYIQMRYLKESRPWQSFVKQVQGYDPFWRQSVKNNIQFFSGFFPVTDSALDRFATDFLGYLRQLDILGVWYNTFEDRIVNQFSPQSLLTDLTALEPYYHSSPWSEALKGKKILVVHPFAESIKKQYARRSSIFPRQEILPDFSLEVVKAVQTIAASQTIFSSWFDALEYMANDIHKRDFDIAIIGAGAYGLPLGAIIKQMGKQAIHLGGATQVLFGIKGKRWDEHQFISSLYNEAWIRPMEEEKPPQFDCVEGGCYW